MTNNQPGIDFVAEAAQLWCKPEFSTKAMDVEFAYAIAEALRSVAERAWLEGWRANTEHREALVDFRTPDNPYSVRPNIQTRKREENQ